MAERTLLESKHFCMLPWVHMHLWPDGRTMPCCIADSDKPIGQFGPGQGLADVWNGPSMRRLRLAMLEDRPSDECRRCYELEQWSQTFTLRKMANSAFPQHFDLVERTAPDGTAPELRMAYLDIRFSNLCNFRCHTCGPQLSSAWHTDQVKAFGASPVPKLVQIEPQARLWAELEPLLPGVEKAYFAGGEPLMCEEHYRVLDAWLAIGKTDVEINYTTNFSTLDAHDRQVLSYWRKFKRVSVSASLDAAGPRAEYLRKGTVWSHIVDNRRRLMDECPHVAFEITPTIGAFNALHFPDFHEEWIELGLITPNQLRLNILTHPPEMSLAVLPAALKLEIRDKYQAAYARLLARCRRDRLPHDNVDAGYRSVIEYLDAPSQQQLTGKLLERMRIIDGVRAENLFATFPELSPLREVA